MTTDSRNVYLASLPTNFNDYQLSQLCAPYGAIVSSKMFNNGSGGGSSNEGRAYGFVLYGEAAGAARAIEELAGRVVGTQRVQVRYAKQTTATGHATAAAAISRQPIPLPPSAPTAAPMLAQPQYAPQPQYYMPQQQAGYPQQPMMMMPPQMPFAPQQFAPMPQGMMPGMMPNGMMPNAMMPHGMMPHGMPPMAPMPLSPPQAQLGLSQSVTPPPHAMGVMPPQMPASTSPMLMMPPLSTAPFQAPSFSPTLAMTSLASPPAAPGSPAEQHLAVSVMSIGASTAANDSIMAVTMPGRYDAAPAVRSPAKTPLGNIAGTPLLRLE
jgi:hypothetical protein